VDYAQAIQDVYDGVAKGDPDPLARLLDDKVEWTLAAGFPYAGTFVGADAIERNVFDRLAADWDSFDTIPDSIVVQGDRAVVIGTYIGKNKASGRDFQARFAHVWQFSGDTLCRFEQIVDSVKVNEAL